MFLKNSLNRTDPCLKFALQLFFFVTLLAAAIKLALALS